MTTIHRSRRTLLRVAALLAAGGSMVLAPGVAFGGSATSSAVPTAGAGGSSFNPGSAPSGQCKANFATHRNQVELALSDRVTRLQALQSRVSGVQHLKSSDVSALSGDLSAQLSGIEELQTKAHSDTTCLQLFEDAKSMIVDYRVYVVMTPQVDIVIAADTEAYVEQVLQGLEPKIQRALSICQSTSATVGGLNCTAAENAFSQLKAHVSTAAQVTSTGGNGESISSAVLAAKPSGYPANRSIGTTAFSATRQAQADLLAARADLETLVGIARSAKLGGAKGTA